MAMKKSIHFVPIIAIVLAAFAFLCPQVLAHCDTMDGPVVKAARKALKTNNVNLVLIWVQQKDESEIRKAFENTMDVRKLSPEAKDLADMYFFETVVRIHRAGEGAPYTGLKPAGAEVNPAVAAADKAIDSDSLENLEELLTDKVKQELREKFKELLEWKDYNTYDVASGRKFVRAYVVFIHYAEGVFEAAHQESAEPQKEHSH
jgi:translation elongation factor EF-1beta